MSNYATTTLFGMLLRWSVSLFPYSGAGTPPMYGDYEAQRHWQEVTVNLPITDWYRNTTDNDLLYWGLDYPPLTAYHSYVCGLAAKFINPNFVSLHSSRGYESSYHKLYMRYTVLIFDLLIYIPASFIISKYCSKHLSSSGKEYHFTTYTYFALIFYPGLYLIDYGHFQYNNVSLGLFLIAVAAACKDYDCTCAVLFSLALNYKQMELYHAFPFFFFLLGKHYQRHSFAKFLYNICKIGFCVICTFLLVWFPFLNEFELMLQVINRVFPIGRGLFEDKVASFWCSVSVLIKLKNIFDPSIMAVICLITTSLFLLPTCLHLLANPKPIIFAYSLTNCSLIFFLFSFHVHEKSILLISVPLCLIYNKEPVIVRWFFTVSIISMLPLLTRDGLLLPTLSLALLTSYHPVITANVPKYSFSRNPFCLLIIKLSVSALFLLSILSMTVSPPFIYPDLYPVLISMFVCCHYILFCIYFHYCQYKESSTYALPHKKIK